MRLVVCGRLRSYLDDTRRGYESKASCGEVRKLVTERGSDGPALHISRERLVTNEMQHAADKVQT